MVMGFGARQDDPGALDAAAREALQVLAFLWGEALPEAPPKPGPTADHHLNLFQWPGSRDLLRRWLDGEHRRYAAVRAPEPTDERVAFIDLTPPWLGGGFRVAKAISSTAAPLAFGDSPFVRHLPLELRSHPIA
jgi:hypothetical protein